MNKEKLHAIIKKSKILSFFKLCWFQRRWRRLNSHNLTTAKNCFDKKRITVGIGTYGELCIKHFGNPEERMIVGNYCSIGEKCTFLLGGDHSMDLISTYPFKTKLLLEKYEATTKGNIIIEDDVWIGYGATILSGVRVGQGSVVAACSVVTKDVPPYAIVAGVPAKVIKYRFSDEICKRLLRIDFSKLNETVVRANIYKLYQKVSENTDLTWLQIRD